MRYKHVIGKTRVALVVCTSKTNVDKYKVLQGYMTV